VFIQNDIITIDGVEHRLNTETNQFEPVVIRVKPKKSYNSQQEGFKRWQAKQKGLTLEEQEERWEAHNKLCEICGKPPKKGRRLCRDHNHKTGKFRGWLCPSCNSGIGMLKDDIILLAKAIEYLNKTG
jgi:hypothetical protein